MCRSQPRIQSLSLLLVCVQDVVALIAYEQPEQSPLGQLLQLHQREVVADAVNAAILHVSAPTGSSSSSSTEPSTSSSSSMPQVGWGYYCLARRWLGGCWDGGAAGGAWWSVCRRAAIVDSMPRVTGIPRLPHAAAGDEGQGSLHPQSLAVRE